MNQAKPMTEESVKEIMAEAGARVMSRGGRTESYSAPREFSFEVKGAFPNGLMLHVVARQYDYRDPWEATGQDQRDGRCDSAAGRNLFRIAERL